MSDRNEKTTDSILLSVKKLLGLTEENEAFDFDIIMNINSAIFTLTQLGVGPTSGFVVTGKEDRYEDWLGDMTNLQAVKMYLYYKTRISFDSPTQGAVMQALKDQISELEFRLNCQVDPGNTFDDENDTSVKNELDELTKRVQKLESHGILDSDYK